MPLRWSWRKALLFNVVVFVITIDTASDSYFSCIKSLYYQVKKISNHLSIGGYRIKRWEGYAVNTLNMLDLVHLLFNGILEQISQKIYSIFLRERDLFLRFLLNYSHKVFVVFLQLFFIRIQCRLLSLLLCLYCSCIFILSYCINLFLLCRFILWCC